MKKSDLASSSSFPMAHGLLQPPSDRSRLVRPRPISRLASTPLASGCMNLARRIGRFRNATGGRWLF
jgi:hypothetical protein